MKKLILYSYISNFFGSSLLDSSLYFSFKAKLVFNITVFIKTIHSNLNNLLNFAFKATKILTKWFRKALWNKKIKNNFSEILSKIFTQLWRENSHFHLWQGE